MYRKQSRVSTEQIEVRNFSWDLLVGTIVFRVSVIFRVILHNIFYKTYQSRYLTGCKINRSFCSSNMAGKGIVYTGVFLNFQAEMPKYYCNTNVY